MKTMKMATNQTSMTKTTTMTEIDYQNCARLAQAQLRPIWTAMTRCHLEKSLRKTQSWSFVELATAQPAGRPGYLSVPRNKTRAQQRACALPERGRALDRFGAWPRGLEATAWLI